MKTDFDFVNVKFYASVKKISFEKALRLYEQDPEKILSFNRSRI